ncbi:MAG TPA: acetoacetate--CoA ligase [Ktedonobacterales bacterium]
MASAVTEGTLLWQPSSSLTEQAVITRYMRWLEIERGLRFATYDQLWQWSVTDLDAFWRSIWQFFDVRASKPASAVVPDRRMPGTTWFPGAELNYAENAFKLASTGQPAVLFHCEHEPLTELSWDDLRASVAAMADALRDMGVRSGDRVAAYMPNIPETLVAFLACASLGAVWSSCSPDFGTRSVIDRFAQIEPTVLFAIDGYQYGGKAFDRRAVVAELQQSLPSLQRTVLVPYLDRQAKPEGLARAALWGDLLASHAAAPLTFEQVPFDHPLWILYSSGTTGLPKAIVQGHGGILLEHLKIAGLHHDLTPTSHFFWFSTTGWMMWNFLVGGLLVGSTILLYDGSPVYPDPDALWAFAAETGMTVFGTSAPYLMSCQRAGMTPGTSHDLSKLVSVGSTGAPLPPETFAWTYEQVKRDLWLASVSGGTDVCTAFLAGCPLLPVRAGELQCRALGAKVEAFDESGHPTIDELGELVITEPMPSMPLYFWNDPDGKRYRESYFDVFPGVWRHGDWIKITPHGSAHIYGRSDSTLNRQGVRMGTSEIYRVVEAVPEIEDSLVLGIELTGGRYYMPLFLVLRDGVTLDDALVATVKQRIREALSPRHIPDDVVQAPAVPRTLNGKKLEVPIKKLFLGVPAEKAFNPGSVANPQVVEFYVDFARRWGAGQHSVLEE